MTRQKRTTESTAPQEKISPIVPDRFTYDVDSLENFLEIVFHAELDADEEILTFITKKVPGFPVTEDVLFDKLERTAGSRSLYYSTSTAHKSKDNELRNQKALFKRFYVLVLDDIGTKVEVAKLPKGFEPTYIIESSPGNFQYGYVLDTPLDVREQAETLVQLVYEAGYSDGGGRMANKLVRLPDGVNGKNNANQNWRVRLIHASGPLWSPTDILKTLDLGVEWADVVEDADAVIKSRANNGIGASAWSPIKPNLSTMDGIIDPVAEWLYDEKMVKQETNEWLTVKCPWADMHTDGGDWASYSPLGWGGPEWRSNRGFHCFHDHCKGRHAVEFLKYVSDANGPSMAVTEHAAHLLSSFVWDRINNGVWEVKGVHQPVFLTLDAFRNTYLGAKCRIPQIDKPSIMVAETTMFMTAPNRVDVEGQMYDPQTIDKITTDAHGKKWANVYTRPNWGDGDYDYADVSMFEDFLKYLIPNETDREFFLDWLAAKTHSMAFRGPAILMIAPSQGTGRTTLGDMVGRLFGRENVERVPFERLAGGGGGSTYNEWLVKPFIITDETFALGDDTNFYKVYERLKEIIDTKPQEVRINPKYGKQRFQITYTSYLMFSNHENAMSIADNDRRIYVLNNVVKPAEPGYFVWLNEWLEKGVWTRSVWRWLRQREVDIGSLLKPPEQNAAKTAMIEASQSGPDVLMKALLDNWPDKIVAYFQIKPLLAAFTHRLDFKDTKHADRVLKRVYGQATFAVPLVKEKLKIAGTSTRVRFVKTMHTRDDHQYTSAPNESATVRNMMVDTLTDKQVDAIKAAIEDALDENDF